MWRRYLFSNAEYALLLGRAVVPGMRERGWGRIVEIDSEVVDLPPPGRSAYVTAKSAQVGLTRSWARELAPYGITVNAVAPGFIETDMTSAMPEENRTRALGLIPLGRFGKVEDAAPAVAFLLSDAASYITGTVIQIDGGLAM